MNAICAHCGKTFTAKRTTATYCGSSCRTKAHYHRKGIGHTPMGANTAPAKATGKGMTLQDVGTAMREAIGPPQARKAAISGPVNPDYEVLRSQLRTLQDARAQLASWREQHVAWMASLNRGALGAFGGGLLGVVLTGDRTPKGRPKYSDGEKLAAILGLAWLGHKVAGPADQVQQSQAVAALQNVDARLSQLDVQIQAVRLDLERTPATLPQPAATVAALPPVQREKKPAAGIVSGMELAHIQVPTLGFSGPFRELVGDPPQGFYMMITGAPKMGKSNLCMQFANYMTKWGNVLYVAAEEGIGYTLQQKLISNGAVNEHLKFSGPIALAELVRLAKSGTFKTIILDSANRMNLAPEDAEKLKETGVNLCAVLQSTKDGSFRGSREWEHAADVIVEVKEKGVATSQGRYDGQGPYQIFAADGFDQVRQIERQQRQDRTLG